MLLARAVVLLLCGPVAAPAAQDDRCLPPLPGRGAALPPVAPAPAPADGGVPFLPLIPPLWKSGETHAHIQLCGDPPSQSVEQLLAQQQAHERQVTFAQLWGHNETVESFLAEWAPLVTGAEDPASAGDPDFVIQLGIEVSKFPAQQFGHVHLAGISDAALPLHSGFPKPILQAARAQPGAITGYAHVVWPTSYALGPLDPYYGGIGYLAPTDTALGLVDFVEAVFQHENLPQYDWRGMYYKLLNAGLRPSLTAGSDKPCVLAPWNETMAARIGSEPLTFDKWTAAIKAGRTTVAEGRKFLGLRVDGVEIGGSVQLAAPGPVAVRLSLASADDHAGVLRVVHDGQVEPGGQPYAIAAGETRTAMFTVQVEESGWIAGEAKGADFADAHTGAVYVIVDGQPICKVPDAQYCLDHGEALIGNLDAFSFASDVERHAVREHIEAGALVFEAMKSGALPLPAGVVRYGSSTPACQGPIQIGVNEAPAVGNPRFAITNVHAPANATGWLVMGTQPASQPIPLGGAGLHVDIGAAHVLHPVVANAGGFHAFDVTFPPALQGATLCWQYVWQGTDDCALPLDGLAASDAIAVTVL
jgi:hypothetical protein